MSEEQQQSIAVLVAGVALSLWVSNRIVCYWPGIPGDMDLQPYVKIWNKPILIHWPSAILFFVVGFVAVRKFNEWMKIYALRQQKEKARKLAEAVKTSKNDEYLPIE